MMARFSAWCGAVAIVTIGSAASGQWCEWEPMGEGFAGGASASSVWVLEALDLGSGPALYAVGDFGGKVARWDGAVWNSVKPPLESGFVLDLEVFDDGSGPALYAAGSFAESRGEPVQCVARWDGSSWSQLGSGAWRHAVAGRKTYVHALEVFDDGSGPALYAAGEFVEAAGDPANFIAKWNGQSWTGVGGGATSYVYDLATFDDGSGPALYAGGLFKSIGGQPISYLARWDGETWSEFGPVDERVGEFTVLDDGTGPALYIAGRFTTVAGEPIAGVARWDGVKWSGIPDAPPPAAIEVFDDGRGPAIYIGGGFTEIAGVPFNYIARWDGLAWTSPGAGVGGETLPVVSAMKVFDDGSGPALIAGGGFPLAGSIRANHVARWRCEGCFPDCDGDRELTFFDFLCFQDHFAAMTVYGDCDGSGAHDVFDFLCFQNAFAAGCP